MALLQRVIVRAFRCRCPACGRGRLYSRLFSVAPECTFCWLPFHREPGYFIAAMYLNFFLAAIVLAILYVLTALFPLPQSLAHPPLPVWIILAVGACLGTLRHARSLWLNLDYSLEPWLPSPPSE